MLKACWECIAGEQQRPNDDDRYNVHMNGSSAPSPWAPSGQFGKIFTVPIELGHDDTIRIKGIMQDEIFNIALSSDAHKQNVVCEVNVVLPTSEVPNGQIQITNTHNGISQTLDELTSSDYFNDTQFDIHIMLLSRSLMIKAEGNTIGSIIPESENYYSDIRYISVIGKVTELNFTFNSDQLSDNQYTYVNRVSPSSEGLLEMYGNNKMFTVPTTLRTDNKIIIKGNMTDGELDIALRPDSSQYNIVCKLNVLYSENGGEDRILISSTQNGYDKKIYETVASDYFYSSEFNIGFTLLSGAISITADGTTLKSIPLQHSLEDIRFISITGQVNELKFIFEAADIL